MHPTQLNIQAWGEEYSTLPRWGLAFHGKSSEYHSSSCHLQLEWNTRDDGKWGCRSALRRTLPLDIQSDNIESIIYASTLLPEQYPDECLDHTQVHSHGGNSPTRANADSVICRCVDYVFDGKYLPGFYLRENSVIWCQSDWGIQIIRIISPHLTTAPWKENQSPRFLP